MWRTDACAPAHERLKVQRTRFLITATALALLLMLLGAVFAPPYVPAPYALPDPVRPIQVQVPAIVIPERPAEVRAPEASIPIEIIPIDEGAEDPGDWTSEIWQMLVPPPQVAAPEQARVVVDRLPVPVHVEPVVYPELAARMGAEGRVVVKAVVEPDGRVSAAEVVWSDTIEALDVAALQAAHRFLFQPGMQGSVPVRCSVEIPFEFALD
jgi:protein TonB